MKSGSLARVVTALACAATAAAATATAQEPVFRTSVDLVRIDALVTDRGKPVAGLGPSDFEVRDNGVLQTVQTAEANGRLDVILALDVSSSVSGDRLEALVLGVGALLDQLRAGDRAALLTFNEDVALRSPLTGDLPALRRSLEGVQATDRTAMNDAVFAALTLARREARTLLLLFSDGVDTGSWLSGAEVIEAARRSDIVVCPVACGLPARGSLPGYGRFLEALAGRTGGRLFRAESISRLHPALLEILTEFRSRYLVAYTPTGVGRDDGWHRVEVRVKTRRAGVTAKDGYLARADR